MRIAFLTHEPFHPPSGGGSAEAIYLVRELVRRGHEVHLFAPEFPDVERVAAEYGITVHPFRRWAMGRYTSLRTPKYLLYPFFLRRLVEGVGRAVSFDLVLSQHAIAAVAAGGLRRSLRVPVVMNFLDHLTAFMETWPWWTAPRPLVRALMRYELSLPRRHGADGVLAVSDPLADRLVAAGCAPDRVLPIYYGYDASLFRYADPAALEGGPPVVVMHGSFDRHHLGPIAATALRVVARERPDVRFRFVGRETETLTAFRRRLAGAQPPVALEVTGFMPYAEVAGQLARAAVGMVPYEESTGVHCAFVAKTVEYLGVGLPVVSTPLESARRYFANEPMVRFAEFEGEGFARQILSWLKEPVARRRAWGQAASERVRQNLDWGVISAKAVDFVERIGRSRPARGAANAGSG